ncbi:exonuclease SbcC [Microbacterium keratanolyticum]|uniref:Nuclease SbcCD subunit C n=1 Tax=Microbacterium keratanolyticum TaxID=67574 RepID=A0A9W6HP58_9MICO|nr:SMC family ATPase [Microbacterium keratanolyticum]MBM7468297.1 exonuclease SbcC [Microbacterium keratanolyticum]GLK00371.1 nuclease SbcCD subunit C [Microbacterium keratanolyticum]
MRLHRLEVEGFGPFRERQRVDFDAFAADGIFLIAGRTGAGKSSILDAVCFGLYGGVPRYGTAEKRLRSDHSEPGEPSQVVVEFSTTAGRFRVTRSPEYLRPAKRGGGLTTEKAAAELEQLRDGEWQGIASRAVDVANELDAILQLTQEQFLQVILLAQNRFADFLLADSKDRQRLLRRLFGTVRFEDFQNRLDERRRASEQALSGRNATVLARVEEGERLVAAEFPEESEADATGTASTGELGPAQTTAQRIDALQHAVARLRYRAERRAAERDDAELRQQAADAALTVLREDRQAQIERDRARVALRVLDEESGEISQLRELLDRARAAEAVRAPIDAARTAEQRRAQAHAQVDDARARWIASAGQCADVTAVGLRTWARERSTERGGWQHVAGLEERSTERETTQHEAAARVTAATESLQAIDAERAALPAQLADLVAEREQLRVDADRREECERLRDTAQARRTAAVQADAHRAALRTSEIAVADASAALASAQTALATLRQRRLDGFAGELATALVDGEPCAVCGSTEHPRPAAHADPVTADDVADAEEVRDTAAAVERDATATAAAIRAELAVAEARAEGRTPAAADADLLAAEDALARAVDAQEKIVALDLRADELRARVEAIATEHTAASAALATAREAFATAEKAAAEACALIAETRGDFDSVAERMAHVSVQIDAALALADAIDEHRARDENHTEAQTVLRDALADSAFADATQAEAALLPRETQAAHERRITAHSVQREKEREILLQLELRILPEEPIDLTAEETAAADARTVWMQAVTAAQQAALRVEQLHETTESAAREYALSATQTAQHEVLSALAATIKGTGNQRKMDLETFVLAAELEEIVTAANVRLHDMSAGRYQLQHSDERASRNAASGLRIAVYDAFTGQSRPPQSLSGGETFLSSLALALGLAEVVTARAGGIQLDTLFIDEGFGSLDADTLEVAMRTLDELRQGGRTVGVISHVEAMQEAIPAQITVRATSQGPSVIDAA